jgi:diguanylate cyclase (GGDEF)-like protein
MTLAALGMTAFGMAQRIYRGYWWWVAAQWLATAGIALQAGWLPSPPPLVALMHALLLQWPVLTLCGLRRFHARHPLPASGRADAALLAAAYLAWGLAWLLDASTSWRIAAFSFGSAVLHGWAASRLLTASEHRDSKALRTFGVLLACVAGMLFARAACAVMPGGPASLSLLLGSGAVQSVVMSLLTVYLTLLLTYERTEHELRESRRRLRVLANIDMLTQVPNRRYFQELARRALERDPPGSAALVMFDIDHFKSINDMQGHAAGDRALKLVSHCTQKTLRGQDIAGRHGGDEFVLMLPRTDTQAAMSVAHRIVARVQARTDRHQLPALSLSFGVVQTQAGESLPSALHRADLALYEAKRQGRGRAVTAFGGDEQPVFGESRRLGLTPT